MVSDEQWRRYTKQAMAGWIAWTSDGTNVAARDAALWNLKTRFDRGLLSTEQMVYLVEAGLTVQGDIRRPWARQWGDLIEGGRKTGIVSDQQWRKYAAQSIG